MVKVLIVNSLSLLRVGDGFRSYTRGEMREDNDMEILVDFPRGITYLDRAAYIWELTEKLKRNIDLVSKGRIPSAFKPYIEQEIIEIYNA